MLVITRRPQEKISFPALGITVQVISTTGNRVRVGVVAPPEVRVLRDELVPIVVDETPQHKAGHALANALSKVTLAIYLAKKQYGIGNQSDAEASLDTALRTIDGLEDHKPAEPRPRGYRLLIVEDDANERELLAGLLGMNGCECITVADGEEALKYLEVGHRPDLVLLDMVMPRCDGPTTLRRIRADQRFSQLRVFSVSSTSPSELNLPIGPSGFDAWFPKPLNPRNLWEGIQSALDSPVTAN